MKNNTNVIDLENIETIYEGERTPVIRDVSLKVKSTEFIAIIGPNGAGKTTLLETINGLLPYTSGQGFVFGKMIKNIDQKSEKISVMFSKISRSIHLPRSYVKILLCLVDLEKLGCFDLQLKRIGRKSGIAWVLLV